MSIYAVTQFEESWPLMGEIVRQGRTLKGFPI